ncbi:MAG: hypothetical protein PHQ43_12810, partial [Dehalococcoidales bacterium]|nr:hypothetical protein [Dehalococcoidales bacterium]
ISLQLLVSLFGAQALSRLGEHFLELNAQFITNEQEVKITGEGGDIEYIRVHPEEITANFDVQVNPDTITKITPVVKQASLMNLKALADKEGEVKLDKKPIWKALINAFPEMDNVGDILVDVEQMAEEHIEEILGGGQPQVSLDDDHKGLLTFVQKHLLEAVNTYDDEILARFLAYVDELRNYLQAANPNLFAPPPQPGMMPTDENALMQSMAGGLSPGANVTQGQPVGLTGDQINQL